MKLRSENNIERLQYKRNLKYYNYYFALDMYLFVPNFSFLQKKSQGK